MLDVQALTTAVYQRLAVDADGAPARAALGAGAAGIIHAAQLGVAPLPAAPFLALRRLAVAGPPGGPYTVQYRIFVYDDPAQGYYRIGRLVSLIMAAFDTLAAPLIAPTVAISAVDLAAGDERPDPALQRNSCAVTLTIYA